MDTTKEARKNEKLPLITKEWNIVSKVKQVNIKV